MSSQRITLDEVLAVCDNTRLIHEPVTASEVAEELGCCRRTAYNKLDELADRGDVHSKKVGARGRVWWRPAELDSATDSGTARARDGTDDAYETIPAGLDGSLSNATERDPLEAEFEDMFDRISDAFYALDDQWQFTYVNDRTEELIDYQGEGLVGKNFWEAFEWAEDSTLGEEYREAMATQEPTSFEFYYPDPLDAWYEVHAYPSETGLSVYFRDVTERREREQALRESEEQLQALIEVLPVAVFVAEDDGQIVEWNEAAKEIWGGEVVESESVAEYAAYDGWWADTGEPVEPDEWALARALRGEKVTDPDEIEIEGFDGKRRTVLNHGMPIRDADGEVSRAVVTLTDITEQKERERELDETITELQESEERLQLALEAGEMGTWELDLQTGDVPIRSPQHDRIFGYEEPLEEWSYETFLDHVHSDDRERVKQRFEDAFETGKWDFECRITAADGERRTISAQGEFHHDSEGEPVRAVGVVQDVTERKEREQELERQERRFEAIFEDPNILVGLLEPDGTVLDINQTAMEYIDADLDEVTDEPFWQTPWWGESDEVRSDVREWTERAAAGEYVDFEADLTRPDGQQYTLNGVFRPVTNDEGDVVSVIVSDRDITERKKRERELERVERQFEAAFNNPSTFMGLLDPDGTVRRANETALEFAGIDEADVRGEKFWETPWFTHSEEIQEELRAGIERAADGEYVRSEFLHRSPDGDTVIIDAMLEPVHDEDGEVVAIVPSGNDITERKQHEERLEQQNDRLESFASMLAHELRNPVNIGQIYSQQLPADTHAEAVEYITEAFERIENMIDVMLMLTRGRKAVGDPSSVELATVAQEAWENVDTRDAALDVDLDRTIQADETYTRNLFRNLLENAVEHGGSDVTVTVGELPDVSASEGSTDSSVGGFYVADDGSGIPDEDQDAVFDQGYTTTADSGGTGLGLAFVQKFAEVYGWEIAVTESEDGGAQFEFRNIS